MWPVVERAAPMTEGLVIQAFCMHLEAVEAGQIRRLIINVPPGASNLAWPHDDLYIRDPGGGNSLGRLL